MFIDVDLLLEEEMIGAHAVIHNATLLKERQKCIFLFEFDFVSY